MNLKSIKCIFHGHHYRATKSKTPLGILNSLIEDEFVYDMVLDRELMKHIEEVIDRYKKKYGNSAISNLICIKCGRRENCIESIQEEMRNELETFLFRPREENLEATNV
jgi:hypothetical protein